MSGSNSRRYGAPDRKRRSMSELPRVSTTCLQPALQSMIRSNFLLLWCWLLFSSGTGCAHRCSPTCFGLPEQTRLISIGEIRATLPATPITVGFDVDDTAL